MNVFAADEQFRLGPFQHAELFSGSSQAWEALPRLPEYRRTVLCPGIRKSRMGTYLRGNVAHRAKAPHFQRMGAAETPGVAAELGALAGERAG